MHHVSGCRTSSMLSKTEWGPHAWKYLHIVAFAYPAEPTIKDRLHAYTWIMGFSQTLPCKQCRFHFVATIAADIREKENSAIFDSGRAFARATVRWHNAVNKRIGKHNVSFSEALRMYTHDVVRVCDGQSTRSQTHAVLVALAGAALLVLFSRGSCVKLS